MKQHKDKFGFLFWLSWILWFAGSFLAAACFWTFSIRRIFGPDWTKELTFCWAVAVFGIWFLLLTPFMRKKEQVWKRQNPFQEKAVNIWIMTTSAFILSLIASSLGWAWFYREGILAEGREGLYHPWVKAVTGTMLLILLPILIIMYRKAEVLMNGAVERMRPRDPLYREAAIERERRLLPAGIRERLKKEPAVLHDGHIVHFKLKDGREIGHVFVRGGCEIMGVYDRSTFDFESGEIIDFECLAPEALPVYDETKWLRLDLRPH